MNEQVKQRRALRPAYGLRGGAASAELVASGQTHAQTDGPAGRLLAGRQTSLAGWLVGGGSSGWLAQARDTAAAAATAAATRERERDRKASRQASEQQ